MRHLIAFLVVCAIAAWAPVYTETNSLQGSSKAQNLMTAAPWPSQWEGKDLKPVAIGSYEEAYFRNVSGQMARFSDGSHEILYRRIAAPTRQLHPSSDCMRASGYSIHPQPAVTDAHGLTWSCFKASRNGKTVHVKEMVLEGNGNDPSKISWPDISSWYGSVWWTQNPGPWTAITVSQVAK